MHEAVVKDDRTQREELRQRLRETRSGLPAAEVRAASAAVCAAVAALPLFVRATVVACYAAHRGEIDPAALRQLLHARGATVAYPRVLGTAPPALGFFGVAADEVLRAGRFGILEPASGTPVAPAHLEVIMVPGIAFARDGHRLGFGGGYYDAALTAFPTAVRIGLCHEFQRVDRLPPRAGDQPVDFIVTPRASLTTHARPLPVEEVSS